MQLNSTFVAFEKKKKQFKIKTGPLSLLIIQPPTLIYATENAEAQ